MSDGVSDGRVQLFLFEVEDGRDEFDWDATGKKKAYISIISIARNSVQPKTILRLSYVR